MSTIIIVGGGPRPQAVTIQQKGSEVLIYDEAGEVFASGFTDEDDARRYLAAIAQDVKPSEHTED